MSGSEQHTFFVFKSEAYVINRRKMILDGVLDAGFDAYEHWRLRLTFADIFRLYEGLVPRATTLLRVPPLFVLDMYLLHHPDGDAIDRMCHLKRRLRAEIWGSDVLKGGFLHSPDSVDEYESHLEIFRPRILTRAAVATGGCR